MNTLAIMVLATPAKLVTENHPKININFVLLFVKLPKNYNSYQDIRIIIMVIKCM